MIRTFMMGGLLMFPLLLITVTVVLVTVLNGWRLARHTLPAGRAGDISLRALPFWGLVALLIGFLGQVIGHYKVLGVLANASVINPRLVVVGLRECLVTTIAGVVICIDALLCWGALRLWRRLAEGRSA